MAEKNLTIPASGGGLIRYYEASRSKIRIKPHYIILMIAVTIIFEFALRAYFA